METIENTIIQNLVTNEEYTRKVLQPISMT